MKDTLYQLLNNDAAELPKAEAISDQEVINIMKRFKEEEHIKTSKTRRKPKIKVALIVAAAMTACVGTVTAAAAASGVFSKLNKAQEQTFEQNGETLPLDKEENHYNYDYIAENAVNIPEVLQAEGDNLAVEVREVYCDGCTTIIGLSGRLKDGNPDAKRLLTLNYLKARIDGQIFDSYNEDTRPARLDGNLKLDEGTENQFSGTIKLVNFGDKEITKSATLEIEIGDVSEQVNYSEENCKKSSGFSLAVPITPDTSKRHDQVYTIEEDGYSVRFYEIAPTMIVMGCDSSEKWDSWIFDENGTAIEGLGFHELPDYHDGFSIACIPPVTNDTLVVSFYDKGGNHGAPNENGYFPSIKEITVDMNEVYNAMKADNVEQ